MSSTLYSCAYKLRFMGSELGKRIDEIIEEQGLNQAELARVAGVSPMTVSLWRSGTTKEIKYSNAANIALKFGYSPEWVVTGQKPKMRGVEESAGQYAAPQFSRMEPEIKPIDLVPLISWVDAGEPALAIDICEPSDAEEWLMCPVPHSSSTYALRVEGDSMTAPTGKSYPSGIDIFVDPEQRGGAGPGDLVIAKINGRDAVTFKQLAREEGRMYLRPLNPRHDPIFEEFRVLGKVIYAGFKP